MGRRKKQQTTEEIFTQVVPVVSCSDETQVNQIMHLCKIPRALTYNKLGSLKGWGLDWKRADPIVQTQLQPSDIGLPVKLWEWSVNDTMKGISAQQEATKTFIVREIHRKTEDVAQRERLLDLMRNAPTSDPWLHRIFRKLFRRGHTFVANQIVYQSAGYSCTRKSRNIIQLEVSGLVRGKRITLKLKCRHFVSGQIRLIRNEQGLLEVHCIRRRGIPSQVKAPTVSVGIDKGYTEAFYTSNGDEVAAGIGKLLTAKTERIAHKNRNRYRLRTHAANNPEKAANILKNNLGYKVKARRLQREKTTIQNIIRKDLRRVIAFPTCIFAEDLTQPIIGKQQSKSINRKLSQWMKGELQASLEKISKETGSTLSVVNPAYTSQIDSQTGTLLGQRQGDRFIRYTGDVVQSDKNAATNILHRGSDSEMTRWMKSAEVRKVLLLRTVRYLVSIGKTVSEAVDLGWLNSKFKAEANRLEAKYHLAGC